MINSVWFISGLLLLNVGCAAWMISLWQRERHPVALVLAGANLTLAILNTVVLATKLALAP